VLFFGGGSHLSQQALVSSAKFLVPRYVLIHVRLTTVP
jgi:hypothetical protein